MKYAVDPAIGSGQECETAARRRAARFAVESFPDMYDRTDRNACFRGECPTGRYAFFRAGLTSY
jgi:hypothetical protein